MFDKIKALKEKGYIPNLIFDIGAHHGNWTMNMLSIYPSSKYCLFEAIDYPELNIFNNQDKIKVYKECILNDKKDIVEWYEEKNTGDSFFKENTIHFRNTKPIKKQTIDLNSIITDDFFKSDNIFIKIDCQGAEIPILKGATSLFNKTDFILIEMPLFGIYNEGVPTFLEHVKYMESINFIPYDIIDTHYINGFNMQVDFLFINKSHEFNTLVHNKI